MDFLDKKEIDLAVNNSLKNIAVNIAEENKQSGFIKNNVVKVKDKISDLFLDEKIREISRFEELLNNADLSKNIYNNQKKALYEAQQSVYLKLNITNDSELLNNQEALNQEILKRYKVTILLEDITERVKEIGSNQSVENVIKQQSLLKESIQSVSEIQNEIYTKDKKEFTKAKEQCETFILENKNNSKDAKSMDLIACHYSNFENANKSLEHLEDFNSRLKVSCIMINNAIQVLNTTLTLNSINNDADTLKLVKKTQETIDGIINQEVENLTTNDKALGKIKSMRTDNSEEVKEVKNKY